MNTIEVNQDQFQFIIVLLKFLSIDNNISFDKDHFEVDLINLKSFILKKVVMPIELKTNLLKNFSQLIDSFPNEIFSNTLQNIFITKNQICSLLKPLITKAAINPLERQKLSNFFQNFACQPDKEEFFLDLL